MKLKIIRILISALFLFTGISKLLGTSMQVQNFAHWGYPLWFMYAIGALEVLAVILLWTKFSRWANIYLLIQMVGVFYTHINSGDPLKFMSLAIVATVLLALHWFMSRKQLIIQPA